MSTRLKIDRPFASPAEVDELVRLFESCELPYERWTHRAHLAVAASYLQLYPLPQAIDRVRVNISRYNRLRGDPNGYHETITVVFMRLVDRELCRDGRPVDQLVNDLAERYRIPWLFEYYSESLLWSAEARSAFVEPDRRPLDF